MYAYVPSVRMLVCENAPVCVCVQLIDCAGPSGSLSPCPPIAPPMRPAILELVILGLRDLRPFQFLPVQKPTVASRIPLECMAGMWCVW